MLTWYAQRTILYLMCREWQHNKKDKIMKYKTGNEEHDLILEEMLTGLANRAISAMREGDKVHILTCLNSARMHIANAEAIINGNTPPHDLENGILDF